MVKGMELYGGNFGSKTSHKKNQAFPLEGINKLVANKSKCLMW